MGKFGVFINDDENPMWESGEEASEVDQVVITNARGEVTTIGSHGGDTWVRIRVNERPQVETYLDQVERKQMTERREMFETEAASAPEVPAERATRASKKTADEKELAEF